MNQQYDNTNKGALFINNDKKTDKHPDYTGTINISGAEHFLSAWLNTSKKGVQFISISIGDVKKDQQAAPVQGFPGTSQPQSLNPLPGGSANVASKTWPADRQEEEVISIDDIPF